MLCWCHVLPIWHNPHSNDVVNFSLCWDQNITYINDTRIIIIRTKFCLPLIDNPKQFIIKKTFTSPLIPCRMRMWWIGTLMTWPRKIVYMWPPMVMYMYIPRCCFCRQALIFLAHLELASSNPTINEFDKRIWNEQWHIIQHDVNCVYAPQCTHRTEVCM